MPKNDQFELEKSLVRQTPNTAHLDIVPVKILEEPLHPSHHHLMVLPSQIQLSQETLTLQVLQPCPHLFLEIVSNRLRVALVELRLEALNLLDAKVIHLRVDFHVLDTRELDFVAIASRQKLLQGLDGLLANDLPFVVKHLDVVHCDILDSLIIDMLLVAKGGESCLLRHFNWFVVPLQIC